MKKQIKVSLEEYNEFTQTSSRKNSIHKFWKTLLIIMPKDIYKEVKKKATKLVETKHQKDNSKIYKFRTEDASLKLQNFLDEYLVEVEVPNQQADPLDPKIFKEKIKKIKSLLRKE